VVVHDGVRPFVSVDEIESTITAARASGAAILVAPVTDTVKQVSGERVVKTLDRVELRRALTPQSFQYELLREAYQRADVNDPLLTDESALVEQLGKPVTVVEGSARNIKITTPADLVIAQALLKQFTDHTDY
jgi:2-C-methyl-D-erythritol 4-phosphate cytidylyltransferase